MYQLETEAGLKRDLEGTLVGAEGLANVPEFGIDHFVTATGNFSEFPARFYGDRARSVIDQPR